MSAPLGVAFTWHQLAFEELAELVERAEALGYAAAYVDGDVSQMARLGERDVLDGWTVATALAARTRRIAIASMRLVHWWNAAHLAQAIATFERIFPRRQRVLIAVGAQSSDRRFGLPFPSVGERIAWLDETLGALRALWRGEAVTQRGRFVALDGARVRPPLPEPPPLEVGAAGARMLALVARHADAWNINLPALEARIAPAAARLDAECHTLGRDPRALARVLPVFARPGCDPDDPALERAYRRFHPWFASVSREELREAVLAGDPAACRARLERLREALRLDLPVVDLTGLPREAALRALQELAPVNSH